MYTCHKFTPAPHFTYCEDKEEVTQWVEIDLEVYESNLEKLKIAIACIDSGKKVFAFEGERKLIYATEAIIPKPEVIKNGINLLLLLGNPAIHSVIEGMFFSYEGTKGGGKRKHRFWDGLWACGLYPEVKPTPKKDVAPENALAVINDVRKQELLNVTYTRKYNFNIFLMTYFSFPTPPSKPNDGSIDYSEVAGIKKYSAKMI